MFNNKPAKNFDVLINSVNSVLTAPEVRDSDLPVDYYQWMTEHCFLPNVRNGQMIVPKKYRADPNAIPLVVLENEDVNVTGEVLGFTAKQTETAYLDLRSFGLSKNETNDAISYLSRVLTDSRVTHVPIDFKLDNLNNVMMQIDAEKFISAPDWVGKDNVIIINGRPMIFASTARKRTQPNYIDGLDMIHELVHVSQTLEQPLRLRRYVSVFGRDYLSEYQEREIEAYHVEYSISQLLVRACVVDERDLDPKIYNLEAIRREENSYTRPFRLTESLKQALVGISSIYDY